MSVISEFTEGGQRRHGVAGRGAKEVQVERHS